MYNKKDPQFFIDECREQGFDIFSQAVHQMYSINLTGI